MHFRSIRRQPSSRYPQRDKFQFLKGSVCFSLINTKKRQGLNQNKDCQSLFVVDMTRQKYIKIFFKQTFLLVFILFLYY